MIIKATRLQAWAPAGGGGESRPAFSPGEGLSTTFYFMVEHFSGLAPPPPTKISAVVHDCKEGSRACSTEIFLCGRNLVSSGHVLLRFCLKNDKNNDEL